MHLQKSIKCCATKSSFQQQLTEDIRTIKNTKTTLTFSDKTSNVYKVPKEQYEKLPNNFITTSYKKVNTSPDKKPRRNILENKEIIKRMFVNGKQNCFITLKDHKPNFQNNPTVRLLNPAKSELGRISKTILDRINVNLRNSLHLNQWKNTQEVIDWFKSIDNKQRYKFIMVDIKDFYPSISKELLTDALTFAETRINLDDHDEKIIYHSRKSLLLNQECFDDVSMGADDGGEVCELIGSFLLNLLGRQYDTKNIGLYRDDGLSIFKNCSGPQMEKIKKRLQKVFKNNGLDAIIECNMKIVNYLDVTFNLNDGTYRPYQKPDSKIQYIHVESNHPPNIIKQSPKTIEKRLSHLSSSEEIFSESVLFYGDKLHQPGYQQKLKYNPANTEIHKKRNHKRNIIWFNHPFSKNVSTKIGKYFLNLLDKHFPQNHRLHRIFNSVKVSNSCTKSMKTIITNRNKNILGKKPSITKSNCNC